jgi:Flp pilus assembly protein TadD
MRGMRQLFVLVFSIAGLAVAAPPPPAPTMELRFDRLTSALTLMSDSDRKVVDQAAQLIREGEHVGALARLSSLTQTNPDNSSLRILIAYVQLQLGNLTGAFDEAKKAHEAPNGNSYRCYFLAKIAFLTGDKVTCQRELNHVKNAGDMKEDARQLEGDLKKSKSKS